MKEQSLTERLRKVREAIANSKEGVVNIKGKNYSMVGLRITKLREEFGLEIGIENIIHEHSDKKVLAECRISMAIEGSEEPILLANGFAEKNRDQNMITKTACVEFCQTTAMGRACAGLGIIGDHNIASAEEMYGVKEGKPVNEKPEPQKDNEIKDKLKIMAEQGLSDEEIKKNLAENLSDITKGLKNKAEKLGEVIADV
jgi:hypothetical protein